MRRALLADIARIASGSAAGQLFVLAAAPALTRLYTPAALGEFAVFLSVVTLIAIVACGRYEFAINLPERDSDAGAVVVLALMLVAGTTLLTSAAAFVAGAPAFHALESGALAEHVWLVPAGVACHASVVALTYWCSRTKRFARVGVSQATGAAAMIGWQVTAGATGSATPTMLIVGNIVGQATAALVLGVAVLAGDGRAFAGMTIARVTEAAARYRRFLVFGSASAAMNNVSWQTPVFLLSALYTPAVAGFYSIGHRVLRFPMAMFGRSLSQVFYQRAAISAREGTLADLVEHMLTGLAAVFLLPSLVLTLMGRDLFVVVFGEPWAEGGVYVQILGLWTFVWFLTSPLSSIFNALERQRFEFWINAVILGSRIAALTAGAWLGGPRLALALFAGTGVLVYGYMLFAIAAAASLPASRVWAIVGAELGKALPWVALVAAALVLTDDSRIIVAVAVLASMAHLARSGLGAYRMNVLHG